MKCPSCQKESKYNKTYDMELCVNKKCNLYLTDDLSKKTSGSSLSINPNYQKRIKEIINEFDFDKVRNVMSFLDWRWRGQRNVPSIQELIQTAEEQLTRLCESILDGNQCLADACHAFQDIGSFCETWGSAFVMQ